jgi:hypothetical protein
LQHEVKIRKFTSQKSKRDKLDKLSQLVFGQEEQNRRQGYPESNLDDKESRVDKESEEQRMSKADRRQLPEDAMAEEIVAHQKTLQKQCPVGKREFTRRKKIFLTKF